MAVVAAAPATWIVLVACLVVQVGFGGYGIGAFPPPAPLPNALFSDPAAFIGNT